MGLISCPKCGEAVSEKATVCPHCHEKISIYPVVMCGDCGTEYAASLAACPCCGNPNASVKKKKSRRKGMILVVIIGLLAAIGVLGTGIWQKAKERTYCSNVKAVTYTMLNGAAKAEAAGNLIKNVWYNTIYEKRDAETDPYTMKKGRFFDDFNDALDALFADESFKGNLSEIQTNQFEVINLMKQLKNPPKKYEEAYAAVRELYEDYSALTKAVISPTGSLNTFSERFSTYVNETVDAYEKVSVYLD